MIGRILKIVGGLVVVGAFIFLFRPDFIGNAGNAFLGSIGSSTAYGSAQLVPDAQGKSNNLQVNLQGLNANTHYVVTLEQGHCGGVIIKSFNGNADTSGNANTLVSLSDTRTVTQQSLWIDVHPDSTTGPSVACGQVQINKQLEAQAASVTPTPTPAVTVVSAGTTGGFANDPSTTTGFPQTGVAPAKNGHYNNYKYPRKY